MYTPDDSYVTTEIAVQFPCGTDELVGVFHSGDTNAVRLVVMLVGGGQYRSGPHRSMLEQARILSSAGIPVLRFDRRGMGDSTGNFLDFENIHADIKAAIDFALDQAPTLSEIVLWGLCDAASAAMLYSTKDKRVRGLVLLNPWVTTERGAATAQLRHYYRGRLFKPEFWRNILRNGINPVAALNSFRRTFRASRIEHESLQSRALPERVTDALRDFQGSVLLMLSGQDLTAREFEDVLHDSGLSPQWEEQKSVTVYRIADADHTYSRQEWQQALVDKTLAWWQSVKDQ